jgi:hypothetical protein
MLELMTAINFCAVEADKDVFKYGVSGDLFYLIIKGKVSIRVPNFNKIRAWKHQRAEFQRLKLWIAKL